MPFLRGIAFACKIMRGNSTMKIFVLISFLVYKAFNWWLDYLSIIQKNAPLPANVRDVYDESEYNNWKKYSAESARVGIIHSLVSTFIDFCFLIFCLHSAIFASLSGLGILLQYFVMIVIVEIIDMVVGLPFSYYDTFVIEEKYGMNKSTKKTFFLDFIKSIVIDVIFQCILCAAVGVFYELFGNTGLIITVCAIIGFSLLLNLLSVPFMKIFNKFTPLEDGELKESLLGLCAKYGVEVKKILVMDASRRTARANAFCTGISKKKTISLDDNLINQYSTEQITAVFAHEFAHARNKHMIKSLPFQLLNMVYLIVVIGIVLNIPAVFTAFGFAEINYVFVFIVVSAFSWPVEILLNFINSSISRKHEYEADAFAAKEGYGEELISALKKLNKDGLGDVNPHPLIVKLKYSHPTLSQRIDAVNRANKN